MLERAQKHISVLIALRTPWICLKHWATNFCIRDKLLFALSVISKLERVCNYLFVIRDF